MTNREKANAVLGQYDPGKLLDFLMKHHSFTCDAELAILLDLHQITISHLRHRRLPLSQHLLNRIQDLCGLSIKEMRDIMDERRRVLRLTQFTS
jgi:hypothetical protein